MRLAKRRNVASVWDILRPVEKHRIMGLQQEIPFSSNTLVRDGWSGVQVQLIRRKVHPLACGKMEASVVHNKTSGSFVPVGWFILMTLLGLWPMHVGSGTMPKMWLLNRT